MNINPAAVNAISTAEMRNAMSIAAEIEENAMSIAEEIGLVAGISSLPSIAINPLVASTGPDAIDDAAAAASTASMHGYEIEGISDVEPHVVRHAVAFYGKLVPLFQEAPRFFDRISVTQSWLIVNTSKAGRCRNGLVVID